VRLKMQKCLPSSVLDHRNRYYCRTLLCRLLMALWFSVFLILSIPILNDPVSVLRIRELKLFLEGWDAKEARFVRCKWCENI
jgi:hypothetical protein